MDVQRLYSAFLECGRVTTDSRAISGGELFFALKGENFDGNEYRHWKVLALSCAAPAAGTARGLRKHLDIFPLDTLVTGYDNLRDPLARHNLERLV